MRKAICFVGGCAVILVSTLAGLGKTPDAAAQNQPVSCTQQWLAHRQTLPPAERYKRRNADAFGRRCLGITAPVPIKWNEVEQHLATTIGADHPLTRLEPVDVATFCPGYEKAAGAERAEFWRTLLIAIVKPEAGSYSNTIMWEQPANLAAGEYSIGLLQLSIINAEPYACEVPDEASLLEPDRNIACGVKIMTKLVTRAGRIGGDDAHGKEGAAAYWSTIRVINRKPPAAGRTETRLPIIRATRALAQCARPA